MSEALSTVFIIVVMLSYVAMQGLIIFLTAYLLRKTARKRVTLSKRRAILWSYCFWICVTVAGDLVLAADMSLLGWSGVVVACLTALASAGLYLWLWQKRDTTVTRKML